MRAFACASLLSAADAGGLCCYSGCASKPDSCNNPGEYCASESSCASCGGTWCPDSDPQPSPSPSPSPTPTPGPQWVLAFEDNFDSLNEDVWTVMDGYEHIAAEKQVYAKDEVFVEDGHLVLRTRYRPDVAHSYGSARDWTSGAVTSASDGHPFLAASATAAPRGNFTGAPGARGFHQTFGRWEWRAQLPRGLPTIWPALWLMPDPTGDGGKVCWPAGSEIDVMEMWGGLNDGAVTGGIHNTRNGPSDPTACGGEADVGVGISKSAPGDYSSGFHTFELEWTPESLSFYVDGVQTGSKNKWEINIPSWPFYMIMNTAICGFEYCQTGSLPEDQELRMLVDYVKVYEMSGADVAV